MKRLILIFTLLLTISLSAQSWFLLVASGTSADVTAPAMPTGFNATITLQDTNKITLTWTDPADGDLDQILIYRDTANIYPTTLVDSVAGGVGTYTTDTLDVGVMYYYRLKASDNSYNKSDYTPTRYEVSPSGKYWYVDRDATGAANGTSWTDAEVHPRDAMKNAVAKGDMVFVSGGTDSTAYLGSVPGLLDSYGVADGIITIRRSEEANHNGEVMFIQTDNNAAPFMFSTEQNIRLTGVTVKYEHNVSYERAVYIYESTNIIIDSCQIYGNGYGGGLQIRGTKCYILDNHIEILTNALDLPRDCIFISHGDGGHTISGNTVIHRGVFGNDSRDMLQIATDYGGSSNYTTTIANNFFFSEYGMGHGLYMNGASSNIFKIYNNIIAIKDTADAFKFHLATVDTAFNFSLHFYNNTVIDGGAALGISFNVANADTVIVKNNLLINYNGAATTMTFGLLGYQYMADSHVDFDYNYLWQGGDEAIDIDTSGSNDKIDWGEWLGLGYGGNSDTGSIAFANIWGESIVDYITTAGRNVGADLSSFIPASDIRAVLRPYNSVWDMGAIEYNE